MPKLLIKIKLEEGANIFKLIAVCRRAMHRTNTYEKYWSLFYNEVVAATYNNAIQVMTDWFDVTWV